MTPETLDLIAGWVSLVLTLMVFSYLLGDNFLYRLAVSVLVGVAAGYVAVVAVESVIVPWINATLLVEQGDMSEATHTGLRAIGAVPFLIGALLLVKVSPRLAPIGTLGLAVLIGTGVAVAIVGAASGTIIPLARETGDAVREDVVEGVVILLGVITTLIYFQYLAAERSGRIQRPRGLGPLATIGQVFIVVTLGTLYAGAILTSLTIFSGVFRDQLQFILDKVGG